MTMLTPEQAKGAKASLLTQSCRGAKAGGVQATETNTL